MRGSVLTVGAACAVPEEEADEARQQAEQAGDQRELPDEAELGVRCPWRP